MNSARQILTQGALAVTAMASQTAQPPVSRAASSLEPGAKWEICIHAPIKHDSPEDFIPNEASIFDIDLAHAQYYPDMIPALKEAGKAIICYFNAGAVQAWDKDKVDFVEEVTGKSLDYPYIGDQGEWYVDVRDSRVVNIMKRRLDTAVEVGCDGVDPDNVDAWVQDGDDPTGFSLQPEDYAEYLTILAEYAHSLETESGDPLLIGQKNAPEIASSLSSILDFAVLESCRQWEFCDQFQSYIDAGKPVFQIEYPPSIEETGSLSKEDNKFYCQESTEQHGDEGFSKILKTASEQLDGWGQYCGGKSFDQPTIDE